MGTKNLLLAAALSGLAFAAYAEDTGKAAAPKDAASVEGQCHGINACKGKSACHSEKNGCAGENSCKSKGWLKTTEKECKAKKGTLKKS